MIAGRNPQKGTEAVAAIKQAVPGAQVRFGKVDLREPRADRRVSLRSLRWSKTASTF